VDVVAGLTQALTRFGPALLGVMTFLETSSLFGLFVPAGLAFLLASFLATQGTFSLKLVVAWAVAGALVGDSVGYWMGRRSTPVDYGRSRSGLLGRALVRLGPKKLGLLAGSPFYAVSLARVVSFVRTLAPMAAGAAGIRYSRFLFYNLGGVVLWAVSFAGVGSLAGESWESVGQSMGILWGGVFLVAVAIAWWVGRTRTNTSVLVPPFSVGLTGNAASGKSSVAGLWRGQGVPVVDADRLARDAVDPGSAGLESVVAAFGGGVLSADGTLDREQLRGIVFENAERRLQLESILHPVIARLRAEWIAVQAAAGEGVVVSEIPLLFETDLAPEFDVTVLVHTPREVSHQRLVEDRGLTAAQADAVLDAQMPSEDKQEKSDYVILNIGSKGDLEDSAMHILGELRARARKAAEVDR
jgi:dephospho-CoA kinase